MKKTLALGILSIMLISSALAISLDSIPKVSNEKECKSFTGCYGQPEVKPEEIKPIIKKSGDSGCISPKWVWNGSVWKPQDLISIYGKILDGKHCIVFDVKNKKLIPKPTEKLFSSESEINNEPALMSWWIPKSNK